MANQNTVGLLCVGDSRQEWVADEGASHHLMHDFSVLSPGGHRGGIEYLTYHDSSLAFIIDLLRRQSARSRSRHLSVIMGDLNA